LRRALEFLCGAPERGASEGRKANANALLFELKEQAFHAAVLIAREVNGDPYSVLGVSSDAFSCKDSALNRH
jgi:hypothetical protein